MEFELLITLVADRVDASVVRVGFLEQSESGGFGADSLRFLPFVQFLRELARDAFEPVEARRCLH